MSQKQLITKLDKLSRLLEEAEKYPVIGCHSELISRAKVLISALSDYIDETVFCTELK